MQVDLFEHLKFRTRAQIPGTKLTKLFTLLSVRRLALRMQQM